MPFGNHERPPPPPEADDVIFPSSPASFVTACGSLSSTSSFSSSGSPPCSHSTSSSPSAVGGPEIEEIPCLKHLPFSREEWLRMGNSVLQKQEEAAPSPTLCYSDRRSEKINTLHKMFTVQGIGKASRVGRISPPSDPDEPHEDVYLSARSGDHRVLVVKGFAKPEQAGHDLAMLSEMDYESVVNVFGCCLEPRRRPLLVYDFFSDKSLLSAFEKLSMRRPRPRVKLAVAADVAAALAYLHYTFSAPVIHRDVRSSVILLHVEDAKLPIFRFWRRGTKEFYADLRIFGASCFIDPDYHLLGTANCMSDVFSFGAFLVELLTGEKPTTQQPPDMVLGRYYFTTLRSGSDRVLADIAFKCLSSKSEDRPTMMELALELGQLVDDDLGSATIAGSQSIKNNKNLYASQSDPLAPFQIKSSGFRRYALDALSLGIHGRLRKMKINKLVKINNILKAQIHNLNQKIFAQTKELTLHYWSSLLHQDRHPSFRVFSLEEIQEATRCFDTDQVVYQGKSTIYKGKLPSDEDGYIAVKVPSNCISKETSINEISILLQLSHNNVVRLLGCCWEAGLLMTVYEFTENGSLHDHIHQGHLPFENRLSIAVDVAEALSYMHSSLPTPVVHGDVRPANVLLGVDYVAKVSGFRASKLQKVIRAEASAPSASYHVDPESISTGQLTSQSDVYSFGVLLAQLFIGKETFLTGQDVKNQAIAARFITYPNKYRLDEILDKNDANISFIDQLKLEALTNVVVHCLSLKGEDRPTMEETAIKLKWLKTEDVTSSFTINTSFRSMNQ